MQDHVLRICRQLAKIDNRPAKDLAEATELSLSTIYRLRNGVEITFVRSSTVVRIAKAMHRTVVFATKE